MVMLLMPAMSLAQQNSQVTFPGGAHMGPTWAPMWGLSGLPSRILDGSATGNFAGPIWADQIDLYGEYMGPIQAAHLRIKVRCGSNTHSPFD